MGGCVNGGTYMAWFRKPKTGGVTPRVCRVCGMRPGMVQLDALPDPDERDGAAHAAEGGQWVCAICAQQFGRDDPLGL